MEIRNSGQNKQTGATLSVSPRQNNGSETTHRKCTIHVPSSSLKPKIPCRTLNFGLVRSGAKPLILSALSDSSAVLPAQSYPGTQPPASCRQHWELWGRVYHSPVAPSLPQQTIL